MSLEVEEPLPVIPGFGVAASHEEAGHADGGDFDDDTSFWLKRKAKTPESDTRLDDTKSNESPGNKRIKFDVKSQKICSTDRLTALDGKSLDESSSKSRQQPKAKHSSVPSTPKDKIKYEDDFEEEITPIPNISYQSALLESMEESALKVRTDEDLNEETPIKRGRNQRSLDKSTEKKRSRFEDKESTPVSKQPRVDVLEEGHDADTDDEDEGGLIIDLSPVEKPSDHVSCYI